MVHTLSLALLLATSLATPSSVQPSDASLRLHRFNQEIGTTTLLQDAQRGKLIREWFAKDLSGLDIGSMGNEDLKVFFVAALNASSLARDGRIAVVARSIFDELDARRILGEGDYVNMQGLYVRLRAFDEARRFTDDFGPRPGLETIPGIATTPGFDENAPSQFSLVGKGKLLLQNAAPDARDFVLVIADPSCHFTRDAVISIQDDPALREYFAQHSKWLAPDGLALGLDAVGNWNQAFPNYPLSLVNDIHDWKGIDYWDTPTFYFYKDGKIVRTLRGWPPEGHAEELKALIAGRTGP